MAFLMKKKNTNKNLRIFKYYKIKLSSKNCKDSHEFSILQCILIKSDTQ